MKIHDFKRKKEQKQKISMLTCYDYPSACIIAASTIDCVLMGDSIAMSMYGHNTTVMATLEMMVPHTAAVARGLSTQFLISDLPFLTYRASLAETVHAVTQLMQAGAHAIKVEGADVDLLQTIQHLVHSGIPVIGHIGLTPQSVHQLGGHRVQGKIESQAQLLIQQARALEEAGCFALVIECVPQVLAKTITDTLEIPTIGIGAGVDTDGQVLVWHDILGLHSDLNLRFVKQFTEGKRIFLDAINAYAEQVHHAHFPTPNHAF